MNFNDFDLQMRRFELSLDQTIEKDVYIVARIDGRGFTKLTKETLDFERPFDIRFHELISDTVVHLMQCGFNIKFAYTQSDEISLLFEKDDQTFSRKVRKINSILAAEASAAFSLAIKQIATFDCRICPLPTTQDVIDYFRWRQSDAQRNALTAYCYWTLRKEGNSAQMASKLVDGLSRKEKKELLKKYSINFDECPGWQRNGSGFVWQTYEVEGLNPVTQTSQIANRRRVVKVADLPVDQGFANYLSDMVLEG